jgi:Tfp pilus assembly protein PilE
LNRRRGDGWLNQAGMTLVELVIVIAMTVAIVVVIGFLAAPTFRFFHETQVRQQVNLEARTCLEALERTLANGLINTLVIRPSVTTPAMPFARAEFSGIDGAAYVITWLPTPSNSIHVLKSVGGTPAGDTVIANNVDLLVFSVDYLGPNEVILLMRMSVPLGRAGAKGALYHVLLPFQKLPMAAAR